MGEMRNAYTILVGKSEGKRSLDTPRRRRQDVVKMDLKEERLESVDWIHS
jgi:hypothetical protein